MKLYAYRTAFFRDPWNVFDFVIVAIALIPATGPFAVLRALRILRVLRLISAVGSMRRVVGALLGEAVLEMPYYHCRHAELEGIPVVLGRTGWTGEVWYEIYLRDPYRDRHPRGHDRHHALLHECR